MANSDKKTGHDLHFLTYFSAIGWDKKQLRSRNPPLLLGLSILLFLGALAFDLLTPLGVAAGTAYVPLVCLSLWYKQSRGAFLIAVICTFFTVIGYVSSPPSHVSNSIVVNNRILSIIAIWITAFIVHLQKKTQMKLSVSTQEKEMLIHKLTKFNEEIKKIALSAAHDMQQPIRNVINYAELLKNKFNRTLNTEGVHLLDKCIQESKFMHQVLSDFSEYSNIENSEQRNELVDCNAVLQRALDEMRQSLSETKAEIHTKDLPVLSTNSTRLILLFQNLIGNAIKYQNPGERPVIHISAIKMETNWLFTIQDNGIGIDEEYHQKIFEPFKRLHKKNISFGTGLGLSICKKIVEEFGGDIWVESTRGKGSTFQFTFPDQNP